MNTAGKSLDQFHRPARRGFRTRGFSLLELLVVVGLIAVLAGTLFGACTGLGRSSALRSGQSLVSELVVTARTRALASGRRARLLINADSTTGTRFRRELVLQAENADGTWTGDEAFLLPEGVFVLPYRARIAPGFFAEPVLWTKIDGVTPLESSLLSDPPLSLALGSGDLQLWDSIVFAPAGTLSGSGDVVLAFGRTRSAGEGPPGDSPVQLDTPNAVRGLSLSVYGLPRLIDDRAGF